MSTCKVVSIFFMEFCVMLQVQLLDGSINGIRVRFIDTPGLVPAASAVAHNAKILAQIKKAHKKYKPDNVLYFDRMDMVRPRPDILRRLCQCSLAPRKSSTVRSARLCMRL